MNLEERIQKSIEETEAKRTALREMVEEADSVRIYPRSLYGESEDEGAYIEVSERVALRMVEADEDWSAVACWSPDSHKVIELCQAIYEKDGYGNETWEPIRG